MKKLDSHNIMTLPRILDTQLDFTDVIDVVMRREQTVGMINMKVNYRRTFEKQREEAWEKRQKEREEFLNKMSPVEREIYLLNEKKRVEEAFQTMAMAQSFLKDSPYSKL